jgi:hypothetical protein
MTQVALGNMFVIGANGHVQGYALGTRRGVESTKNLLLFICVSVPRSKLIFASHPSFLCKSVSLDVLDVVFFLGLASYGSGLNIYYAYCYYGIINRRVRYICECV